MDRLETFIQSGRLRDSDDMEPLLEAADITRQLLESGRLADVAKLIGYTVENGCYEAFSWILEILQEAYEADARAPLPDLVCELGRAIPGYDEFAERLAIDYTALRNDVEKVCDEHGEVQAFFNVCTYRTRCSHIFLVTAENFDTKDNDFIQYRLLCTGSDPA